jgi:hypothetical protein
MITALVLVYVTVCVGGHFVVGACLYVMRRLALKHRPGFFDWSVFFIGATERAVALTLVLVAPPYLPAFVGGWVVLKFALGWQRETKNSEVAGFFRPASLTRLPVGLAKRGSSAINSVFDCSRGHTQNMPFV